MHPDKDYYWVKIRCNATCDYVWALIHKSEPHDPPPPGHSMKWRY